MTERNIGVSLAKEVDGGEASVIGSAWIRWKVWCTRPRTAAVLSVGAVLAAAFLYLLPALLHGVDLGTEDLLGTFGLGTIPGTHPHNVVASDQVMEMMPWAALSWIDVRGGHLPLWNSYSGLGLPLLFNWSAASFSLPMLVSYLGPEHLVYTIEIAVKMVIAGTGVLWMCRRLGLSHLPSVMGAIAFMLSGSFTAWLGWPMTGTTAWLGWAGGAVVMVVRGERRALHVAGLAVILAFVIYGGHPETLLIVLLATAILSVGALVDRALRKRESASATLRSMGALAAGGAGGFALGAPLLLPGIQLVERSARKGIVGYPLPVKTSVDLVFASYFGLPTTNSQYFGPVDYYEIAAYVGVIVLVLACVGFVAYWRKPLVLALGATALLAGLVTYSTAVSRLLDGLPDLGSVQWTRALLALDFALACLGAFGLQAVIDSKRRDATRRNFAILSAVAIIALSDLWVHHLGLRLPQLAYNIQARSFIWPAVGVVALAVCSVLLWLRPGPLTSSRPLSYLTMPRMIAGILVMVEAAFLVTATPGIWSSSNKFFPVTTAERALQEEVGGSRVGFADCPNILDWPDLGILVEANDMYGVSEVGAYDGIIPWSYFTAYARATGTSPPVGGELPRYCPSMSSATVARHFGVGYVLAEPGTQAPQGMEFVAEVGGENLYRVPGAGLITVESVGDRQDAANAVVERIGSDSPNTVRTVVNVSRPSEMYIHITDFPGWTATIGSRRLKLRDWGGTMLAARVPSGRHVIMLRYQPRAFKVGVVVAGVAALVLVGGVVWSVRTRRSREQRVGSGQWPVGCGEP